MRLLGVALAAFAFVAACDEPISRGWLVDRTRILGARVEVVGEPARSSVRPGEEAKLTWLIASPSSAPPIGSSFAVCVPPAGNFAEPRCQGPLLAFGTKAPAFGPLETSFVVPPADSPTLLVLAAFCAEGTPALDASLFQGTCPSGEPLLASLEMTLLGSGAPNASPTIPDDALSLDDVVLPPTAAGPPGAPCAPAPDAPLFAADGRERKLAFRFDDGQREAFDEGGQPKREALVLTHVVTGGELERQFSAFDPEEPAPKVATATWKPPPAAEVPDAGRVIEILLVLRDGRGGAAFARRAVCAKKP